MKFQRPKIYSDVQRKQEFTGESVSSGVELTPTPREKQSFWKSILKIFTVEFASLSILEILIFVLIVGGGIFYIKGVVQKSYEDRLREKITTLEELEKQSEQNAYDKVKISDTTNILLALQDYNYEKGDLPRTLSELKNGAYLAGYVADPELGKPYYYQRKSSTEYVLCVYLSTGLWGANIAYCPSKEAFASGLVPSEAVGSTAQGTEGAPAVLQKQATNKQLTVTKTETGFLRVREAPSIKARALTRILPGQTYTVLEENDEWAKIQLAAAVILAGDTFTSGWVSKAYATIR